MKKKFTVIKFFPSIKTGKKCVITPHFANRHSIACPVKSVRQLANYFTGALLFFCILLLPAAAFSQSWLWAKSAGGTDDAEGCSVTTDATGNVFVTGSFTSPITFGTYTLTTAGWYDFFLVKYNPSGNVLWAKSAGGNSADGGLSVTTDATGNVFVTGGFYSSSITFGTYTLTNHSGGYDIFLVKYDENGNVLWAKSAGGTSDDEGYSVTTDATGNVFVTGYFSSSSITFGTYTLTNADASGYSADIFLVKYDPSGNVVWAKSAGGTSSDYGYSVTTAPTGNVFVTGYFYSSSITFGTYTLTNAGNNDIFLVKYDPADGGVLWAKSAVGIDYDYGYSVATAPTGNVFVTGSFYSSSITFGTYTLTNTGDYDIFLVKYDPANGGVLWAKSAGGTNWDYGNSVTTDATGNVFVTGDFSSSSITFGTYTLTNAYAGRSDIFVAKLSDDTGIEEISTEHNITIYPNPATTEITILTPTLSKGEGEWAFMLYDMLGHEVYNTKLETINSIINLSTLPSGVYLVKVMCKSDVWTSKVIIQSELK